MPLFQPKTEELSTPTTPTQETIQPSNPYFVPLLGAPQPGDIIMFIYNKPLAVYKGQQGIHDRSPLLLVLEWRRHTKQVGINGINLHYLTYDAVGNIIQSANKGFIKNYDHIKSFNVNNMWSEAFRSYLWPWINRGTMRKMNPEAIQADVNTIKQYGAHSIKTLEDIARRQIEQRTGQKTAAEITTQTQPPQPIGTIPGIAPTPGIAPVAPMGAI